MGFVTGQSKKTRLGKALPSGGRGLASDLEHLGEQWRQEQGCRHQKESTCRCVFDNVGRERKWGPNIEGGVLRVTYSPSSPAQHRWTFCTSKARDRCYGEGAFE